MHAEDISAEPTSRRHIRRLVRGTGYLALAWIAFVVVRIVQYGTHDEATRADAIVVLGAAAYGDVPSPVLRGRIDHAIRLFRRGLARTIVFTGGVGRADAWSEAEVARRYALGAGVPERAILMETTSTTTRGNLEGAQRVMHAHGLRTAIVVSDSFHLYRAHTIARDLGFPIHTSPTATSAYRSLRTKSPFFLRELVYFHLYIVRRV